MFGSLTLKAGPSRVEDISRRSGSFSTATSSSTSMETKPNRKSSPLLQKASFRASPERFSRAKSRSRSITPRPYRSEFEINAAISAGCSFDNLEGRPPDP